MRWGHEIVGLLTMLTAINAFSVINPARPSLARLFSSKPAAASEQRPAMPPHSPATSLPNQIFQWRDYQVRYQVSGPRDADHVLLLVHGLFVNSDHWRKTLTGLHDLSDNPSDNLSDNSSDNLSKGGTCRVYALDLLGSGWSSKPRRDDPLAALVNGENGRFLECDSTCYRQQTFSRTSARKIPNSSPETPLQKSSDSSLETLNTDSYSDRSLFKQARSPSVLENVTLGTAGGSTRVARQLELRHPLRSPYNFYTWAEQIVDFVHDVIRPDITDSSKKVTLVSNSIGTMSSLQSIIDDPQLFNGIFIINPNFRELHMAEVPFATYTMPLVRALQSTLRNRGHPLFRTLAKKDTVAKILEEPYQVKDAIDDTLVSVLLDPLLTEGADDVVFDTLSYSAGPLPEQQLTSPHFPNNCPVWIVYGKDDPWTPPKRVENLINIPLHSNQSNPVERVIGLEGAGHCPHDECPQLVNPLIMEFVNRLNNDN